MTNRREFLILPLLVPVASAQTPKPATSFRVGSDRPWEDILSEQVGFGSVSGGAGGSLVTKLK